MTPQRSSPAAALITDASAKAAQFLIERTCPFYDEIDAKAKAWLAAHGPMPVWVELGPCPSPPLQCGHRTYRVLRQSVIAARRAIGFKRMGQTEARHVCAVMGRFIE